MPLKTKLVALGLLGVQALLALDSDIKINSIGYLPEGSKKAYISASASNFSILDAGTNEVVFEGATAAPISQSDIGQTTRMADFTAFSVPGEYILEVSGVGKSSPFKIENGIYEAPFQTAMRAFYLWRCGMAVNGSHNGSNYRAEACHLQDGDQSYIGGNGIRNGTQGWHDAGDYGKYTINAGITLGTLMWAWQLYQEDISDIPLNLPQTYPGLPEFLQEIKWETDWLLKMAYPDNSGKVSHKLTRLNFSAFIMPEEDTEVRYFTDWSSAATANFAAALAMASRVFRPYNAEYADSCLEAAKTSYNFLQQNTQNKNADLADFSTGGYQSSDPDDRIWMAAELWEATGEAQYLNDLENRIGTGNSKIDGIWDWGNIKNLGVFTYLQSTREGKNSNLLETIRSEMVEEADNLVSIANSDAYGRILGDEYSWGCNGVIMRQTLILEMAQSITPKEEYEAAMLSALAHVFGANFYGRSYVTGLGANPPMFPHDRRSGADGIEAPWPGYIVGGGHSATDWVDVEESYETNEIAINWQAGLVFALAKYAKGGGTSGVNSKFSGFKNYQNEFWLREYPFFYQNGILPQKPEFKVNGKKLSIYRIY